MTKKLTNAVAGALALSAASVGGAQAADYQLRYNTAELASADGAAGIYERIQHAAADYCNDRYGRQSIVKYRAARDRCVSNVVEDLVRQVNDPRLNDLHASAAPRA